MLGLLAEVENTVYVSNGIGIGAALAIVASWQRNRSLLWAILAGILSWIYVIYFALTRRPDEAK
jgi:ABC-type Fe3+-siderophore transport system permease subunit